MQMGRGPTPWSSMARSEVGVVGVVAAEDVSSDVNTFEESGRLKMREIWKKSKELDGGRKKKKANKEIRR